VSVSAGHIDRHAGDEIGVARCQEADHLGLVRRLGDAPQRRPCDFGGVILGALLLPAGADPLGQGAAWGDRVDVDAMRAELKRDFSGKGDDPAFGSGVGSTARPAVAAAGDRREIDDLAMPLPLHDRRHRMTKQECAFEVEGNQPLPVARVS
jgi:hypothetical protein